MRSVNTMLKKTYILFIVFKRKLTRNRSFLVLPQLTEYLWGFRSVAKAASSRGWGKRQCKQEVGHWTTLWRHCCLSSAAAATSFQLSFISLRSFVTYFFPCLLWSPWSSAKSFHLLGLFMSLFSLSRCLSCMHVLNRGYMCNLLHAIIACNKVHM